MERFEGVMPEEMQGYNPEGAVLKKAKTQGLVISRIPKSTREEFVKFAEEQFADDYGLLLKHIWDEFKKSQILEITFFENINMKLDYLIGKIDDIPKQEEKKPTKEIKFLDGKTRRIEKEVKNVTIK